MDYYTLDTELASIEAEKAILMLESCDYYFEGKKDKYIEVPNKGLFDRALDRLGAFIDKLRLWFRQHFGSNKVPNGVTVQILQSDMDLHRERMRAANEIDRKAHKRSFWPKLAIASTIGLVVVAAHSKKKITLTTNQLNKVIAENQELHSRMKRAKNVIRKAKISRDRLKGENLELKAELNKRGKSDAVERIQRETKEKVEKKYPNAHLKEQSEEKASQEIVSNMAKITDGSFKFLKSLGAKIAKATGTEHTQDKSNMTKEKIDSIKALKKEGSNIAGGITGKSSNAEKKTAYQKYGKLVAKAVDNGILSKQDGNIIIKDFIAKINMKGR